MKNILIGMLLAVSVLFCSAGVGFGAEMTYQVTAQELTELEVILSKLESINKTLSSDLKLSKEDLGTQSLRSRALEIRLTELSNESKLAKADLLKAQDSLAEVKKSFEKYEKEMNRKLIIKKRQKVVVGILGVGLGFLMGGAVSK